MAMTIERITLKVQLLANNRHRVWREHQKIAYQCEMCDWFFQDGMQVHEPIISRNDVRGVARLSKAITESNYNASLICAECNAGTGGEKMVDGEMRVCRAEATWARDKLTDKLIRLHGSGEIIAWIEGLGMKLPQPYILYVKSRALVVAREKVT